MFSINRSFVSAFLLLTFSISMSVTVVAQIPAGYYQGAEGLSGTQLQEALHNIIKGHTVRSYSQLWTDFKTTDKKANGKVWDMYSDIPGGTPPYEYTFSSDQCGNYSGEGDCYNREHSFPASWFNDQSPMYSDLFQLVPTDGYVNNRRSNYPFGEVGVASWTSLNGCLVGSSASVGYSGTVFEPSDAYKGDFARNILYMATRYYTEDGNWPGSPMVDGAEPLPWARKQLLLWHAADPVSEKEIARNDAVYGLQHNRNPYIDRPEFAELIWGDQSGINHIDQYAVKLFVYPNPAGETVSFDYVSTSTPAQRRLLITDLSGRQLMAVDATTAPLTVNLGSELKAGFYLVELTDGRQVLGCAKLIKR
ncbi:MAG: endonuclease [Bacteroidetes bacterium]|nr:endonuclease [Bacteroidota bacterium]